MSKSSWFLLSKEREISAHQSAAASAHFGPPTAAKGQAESKPRVSPADQRGKERGGAGEKRGEEK